MIMGTPKFDNTKTSVAVQVAIFLIRIMKTLLPIKLACIICHHFPKLIVLLKMLLPLTIFMLT